VLRAGNFNGDDYDDLAIGIPLEDIGNVNNSGTTAVLWGGDAGLTGPVLSRNQETANADTVESGDRFGDSLAAGDFDGDTFDDLAIGAPLENLEGAPDAGLVAVLFGDPPDNLGPTEVYERSLLLGSLERGDRFGEALVGGNFDGDDFEDLVIGMPSEDVGTTTDAGVIVLLFGGPGGLDPSREPQVVDQASSGNPLEAGDRFGQVLAAADFDGDGDDDLAVGIPEEAIGDEIAAGALAVLYGTPQGFAPTADAVRQEFLGFSSEESDRFGAALATGDFDGDGFEDLAVGGPGENDGVGGVRVLFGTPQGIEIGLNTAATFSLSDFGLDESAASRFGHALAAGDFDRDGVDDLAASAPGSDAGLVVVLFGDADRNRFKNASRFESFGPAAIDPDGSEMVGRLGEALASGDFDGDGVDDLALRFDTAASEVEGSVAILFGASSPQEGPDGTEGLVGPTGSATRPPRYLSP
jgi:hypothetical protein